MNEMSDFQKQFLAKGTGQQLFTQKEFDEALYAAQLEIMTIASETAKKAVLLERESCAKMVAEAGHTELAKQILTRLENAKADSEPAVSTDS